MSNYFLQSLAFLKTQGGSTGLEDFQYSPDSVGELQDLAAEVSSKWRAIARYLDVPQNTIDSIDQQHRVDGMDECLMKVFDWWQKKRTKRYTWATIITVLEKPGVGHRAVAQRLRQTLDHREPDPSA